MNAQSKKGVRRLLAPVLLVGCLSLQGCFTAGLWASDLDPRGKAGLTPLALTLDAVTLPAQIAILDHGHHRGHRHRCR